MRPLPQEKMTKGLVEGFYATVAQEKKDKGSRRGVLCDRKPQEKIANGHVDPLLHPH
jgi:hypothetical protein